MCTSGVSFVETVKKVSKLSSVGLTGEHDYNFFKSVKVVNGLSSTSDTPYIVSGVCSHDGDVRFFRVKLFRSLGPEYSIIVVS